MKKLKKTKDLFDVDEIDFFIGEDGKAIDAKHLKEWNSKKDRYRVALKLIDAGYILIPFERS